MIPQFFPRYKSPSRFLDARRRNISALKSVMRYDAKSPKPTGSSIAAKIIRIFITSFHILHE